MVATDGDVVAIALLNATTAYKLISLNVDVFGVLEQDANGALALEDVLADGNVAIDARGSLRRFGGEHDCRGPVAVGGARLVDMITLDEDMLHGTCFAPSEFGSQFDGRERASADIVARNGNVASLQEESPAVVVDHLVVLNPYAWESAVVVHEAFLGLDACERSVQSDRYSPVGP